MSRNPAPVRRVLYADAPREQDFLDAAEEVKAIRTELGRLRSRLEKVGNIEAEFWFDRIATKVAGALTIAIMALYSLVEGESSLIRRAENSRKLWADAEAHPDLYIIEETKK